MMRHPLSVRMVIQPSINHYREPLIKELLASKRIDFSLFGTDPRGVDTDPRNWAHSASPKTLNKVDTVKTRAVGRLRWQSHIVKSFWRKEFDAYVIEGNVYILSAWVSLLIARVTRKPVFLWGHGWKREETGLKLKLRRLFYSLSGGLMLYGTTARDFALRSGFDPDHLAVVYNSIYPDEVLANPRESDLDVQLLKRDLGLDPQKQTLIVSCRLTPRHQIDDLADAIGLIADLLLRPNVLVIGEGTERPRLEAHFSESGVQATFVGGEYDTGTLNRYFQIADLAVSPAASGLNVVQALGFGVPVVVPAVDPNAGPEAEAVVHGSTGVVYTLNSAESLKDSILDLLSDPIRLNEMGEVGRRLVRQHYTAERHAEAIEICLLNWLGCAKSDDVTQ